MFKHSAKNLLYNQKKMKIALLTIWRCKNYGAEMQTYATIRALRELGHEVEVIDFRLSELIAPTFKQRIIQFLTSINKEDPKFKRFWKSFIPTTRHYKTMEELQLNPPVADLYLVGSDQVWNPEITKKKAPVYFLNFGNDDVLRASYASSIGTAKWEGDEIITELAKKQLVKFKAVSCREKTGTDALRKVFDIDITTVLDPTLLHKEYIELTGKIEQQNTLVYYPLFPFDELESFCRELAEELGKDFLNANEKKLFLGRLVWDRPSVEEWVRSFAQASLVVTPSFHGLTFSLIYSKQFIIVQNPDGESKMSRITNLLSELGLEDRLFISIEDARKSKIWTKQIDYAIVEEKLNILRKKSFDFLNKLEK